MLSWKLKLSRRNFECTVRKITAIRHAEGKKLAKLQSGSVVAGFFLPYIQTVKYQDMKMKKVLWIFSMIVLCSFMCAQNLPLIEAAKAKNFPRFRELVASGVPLDETTEKGLNLQLALAYFSDEDFAEACSLLDRKGFDFDEPAENGMSLLYSLAYSCSYEKLSTLLKYNVDVNRINPVSDMRPIDATQFNTYKFYGDQVIPEDAFYKAERVRKLLLENGSEDFEPVPLTMGKVGNFFFCNVNLLCSYYSYLSPMMLNVPGLFTIIEEKGQTQATIMKEDLIDLYSYVNIDLSIDSYTEPDEILEKLEEAIRSDVTYGIIAFMGRNPIAPHQCVNLSGNNGLTSFSPETWLKTVDPDANYDFVDFQIKDISQLLLLNIEFMEY